MSYKTVSLSEALVTGAAHIRLLTGMHSHVDIQVAIFTEGFLAYSADVWHLTTTLHNFSCLVGVFLAGRAEMKLLSRQDFLAGIAKTPSFARMWGTKAGSNLSLCDNVCNIR